MDKEDPEKTERLYFDNVDVYYTSDRQLSLVSRKSKLVASGTSIVHNM